jgi:hypothetical protein
MRKFSLLKIYENIIDEFGVDKAMFPSFDLDKFKSLTSFKAREQYCNQTLKRIASGSSRIVYQIDGGSVLKLAKNSFGQQQNSSESNEYNHDYFSEIRTNVIDYDHEDDLWVISEIATKITPAIFKQHTGFNLNMVDKYLNLRSAQNNGAKITNRDFLRFMNQKELDSLDDDDFIGKVVEFMFNNGLEPGDLGRISSWGMVNRNGVEQIVLTDYGYTSKK